MPTNTPRLTLSKPASGDNVSAFQGTVGTSFDNVDANAWINKGAWSLATAYAVNDVVQSGGLGYICVSAHTNHVPPNATYWSPLALLGSAVLKSVVTAAGDLIVGTGNAAVTRLAKGLPLQVLRVNAGGTALEYAAASGASFPLTNLAATGTTVEYQTNVTADTQKRFTIDANGKMSWGSGSAAADVTLARSAAGSLLVTGNLLVSSNGGTSSVPKVFGFEALALGQFDRLQFGDSLSSLQTGAGQRLTMQNYWGIEIVGSRQTILAPRGFTAGATTDPVLSVIATKTNTPTLATKNAAGQTADSQQWQSSTGAVLLSVAAAGHFTFADAVNMIAGTTTGTKVGTGTTQKLGFWNATPVVQQTVLGSRTSGAALANLLTTLATLGLIVNSTTT